MATLVEQASDIMNQMSIEEMRTIRTKLKRIVKIVGRSNISVGKLVDYTRL